MVAGEAEVVVSAVRGGVWRAGATTAAAGGAAGVSDVWLAHPPRVSKARIRQLPGARVTGLGADGRNGFIGAW